MKKLLSKINNLRSLIGNIIIGLIIILTVFLFYDYESKFIHARGEFIFGNVEQFNNLPVIDTIPFSKTTDSKYNDEPTMERAYVEFVWNRLKKQTIEDKVGIFDLSFKKACNFEHIQDLKTKVTFIPQRNYDLVKEIDFDVIVDKDYAEICLETFKTKMFKQTKNYINMFLKVLNSKKLFLEKNLKKVIKEERKEMEAEIKRKNMEAEQAKKMESIFQSTSQLFKRLEEEIEVLELAQIPENLNDTLVTFETIRLLLNRIEVKNIEKEINRLNEGLQLEQLKKNYSLSNKNQIDALIEAVENLSTEFWFSGKKKLTIIREEINFLNNFILTIQTTLDEETYLEFNITDMNKRPFTVKIRMFLILFLIATLITCYLIVQRIIKLKFLKK